MIDYFDELIVGSFENKIQAFSHPSKWAFIRITHKRLLNGLYYGEQAYNYQLNRPYRQFVLEPIVEHGKIRIINHDVADKQIFINGRDLNQLTRARMRKREGCDVILERVGDDFVGGLTGCNCMVDWKGKDTYLQNEIKLTKDFYYVKDLGYDAEDHKQLWGSKHGPFEFRRMPN